MDTVRGEGSAESVNPNPESTLQVSNNSKNGCRFFCPFPACNRSFAELWRLKVHYRAPPDVRGSGKERGHGMELDICPKCMAVLKPGRHHIGCSGGTTSKRSAGNERKKATLLTGDPSLPTASDNRLWAINLQQPNSLIHTLKGAPLYGHLPSSDSHQGTTEHTLWPLFHGRDQDQCHDHSQFQPGMKYPNGHPGLLPIPQLASLAQPTHLPTHQCTIGRPSNLPLLNSLAKQHAERLLKTEHVASPQPQQQLLSSNTAEQGRASTHPLMPQQQQQQQQQQMLSDNNTTNNNSSRQSRPPQQIQMQVQQLLPGSSAHAHQQQQHLPSFPAKSTTAINSVDNTDGTVITSKPELLTFPPTSTPTTHLQPSPPTSHPPTHLPPSSHPPTPPMPPPPPAPPPVPSPPSFPPLPPGINFPPPVYPTPPSSQKRQLAVHQNSPAYQILGANSEVYELFDTPLPHAQAAQFCASVGAVLVSSKTEMDHLLVSIACRGAMARGNGEEQCWVAGGDGNRCNAVLGVGTGKQDCKQAHNFVCFRTQ